MQCWWTENFGEKSAQIDEVQHDAESSGKKRSNHTGAGHVARATSHVGTAGYILHVVANTAACHIVLLLLLGGDIQENGGMDST